jgi:hypothetical protein
MDVNGVHVDTQMHYCLQALACLHSHPAWASMGSKEVKHMQ